MEEADQVKFSQAYSPILKNKFAFIKKPQIRLKGYFQQDDFKRCGNKLSWNLTAQQLHNAHSLITIGKRKKNPVPSLNVVSLAQCLESSKLSQSPVQFESLYRVQYRS